VDGAQAATAASPSKRRKTAAENLSDYNAVKPPPVVKTITLIKIFGCWFVRAPAILMFLPCFETTLFNKNKIQTRRHTNIHKPWCRSHIRAFDQGGLVRVWCGKQGVVVGHAQYSSLEWQRLGDLTVLDVAMEGYAGKSVKWYRAEWFNGLSDDENVLVLSFTFYPVQAPGSTAPLQRRRQKGPK
jgi:hypothetical protein